MAKFYTLKEWQDRAVELFGEDMTAWRFKCPSCGETQSLKDFEANGIYDAGGLVYYSCIGRYVEGRGCDWMLGGLFQMHTLEVKVGDRIVPVFEFADDQN